MTENEPITRAILTAIGDLRTEVRTLAHKVDALDRKVDLRFVEQDAKIDTLDHKVTAIADAVEAGLRLAAGRDSR